MYGLDLAGGGGIYFNTITVPMTGTYSENIVWYM